MAGRGGTRYSTFGSLPAAGDAEEPIFGTRPRRMRRRRWLLAAAAAACLLAWHAAPYARHAVRTTLDVEACPFCAPHVALQYRPPGCSCVGGTGYGGECTSEGSVKEWCYVPAGSACTNLEGRAMPPPPYGPGQYSEDACLPDKPEACAASGTEPVAGNPCICGETPATAVECVAGNYCYNGACAAEPQESDEDGADDGAGLSLVEAAMLLAREPPRGVPGSYVGMACGTSCEVGEDCDAVRQHNFANPPSRHLSESVTLDCPYGLITSVEFASYGLPRGQCGEDFRASGLQDAGRPSPVGPPPTPAPRSRLF